MRYRIPVPSLPKSALAVAGVTLGAVLAVPVTRKKLVKAGRMIIDEVVLQADTPWTRDLLVLTSEGRLSGLPRTAVLFPVQLDGDVYVLPWDRGCGWFHNVRANPDVVVDDRVKVHRATAEVVDGEVAERVRLRFLERFVPARLRGLVSREGAPWGPAWRRSGSTPPEEDGMGAGRARLIANASARGNLAVADEALAICAGAGWEAELTWTEMRGHGVLLAEEAAIAGSELVLSVGGDGTAREVAAGLAGSETGLGIVPAGTGNSSYRELFGEAGWRELLAARLLAPAWRQVDLLRVDPTGEYSLLGFSAGWFAQIVALAEAGEGSPGPGRYATAALQAVADPVRFEAHVELDGVLLAEGELGLLTAGGARVRAAVFPVLPDSLMDDGLLDVLAVRAAGPEEFNALLQTVHSRQHLDDPLVSTGRGSVLTIRAAMPLPIEIDGDLWDRHLGVTRVVVVPGVLRVLAAGPQETM